MAYNHEYPYTDPNRYNADWILNKIKELDHEMETFEALNKITFAGEWDITKQYPAWCIVNWNNDQEGYISIQPVPAGVTIDNTDYWVAMVNYTATIADLQNRVIALETTVGDATSGLVKDVDDLQTAVGDASSGLVKDVNDLQTAVGDASSGLVKDVNDLQTAVGNIPTQRHVIICGDSYTQGVGGGTTNLETVIESITDWDVRRFYSGGCGYLRVSAESKKMLNVVEDAIAGTSDKELITDVVLAASVYNDTALSADPSFTEASFISAIQAINTLIKANFPNARVTVAPALWINISYNSDFIRIAEWTQSAAQKIGANYAKHSLDWLTVYDTTVNASDNVHPSAAGYKILGNHIATLLNGSEPNLYAGLEKITTATNDTLTIRYYSDHAHINCTFAKETGQVFSSLFNVPQALQKLSNYPVPFVAYGAHTAEWFLITGSSTFFASDWLTVGTTYLIDYDIPYNNLS